jgi:hypothetical protein
MARAGFEQIEVKAGGKGWWKAIGEGDRHILIQSTGDRPHLCPDWKTRRATISIYRGPDLQENLEHHEIAYTVDDLVLFLEEMQTIREGEVN